MNVYLCKVCGHCVAREGGAAPSTCCAVLCSGEYRLVDVQEAARVEPVKLLRAMADPDGLIPTKRVRELLGDDWRPVVVGMLATDEAEFVRNERGGWCSILRLKAVPARGRAA